METGNGMIWEEVEVEVGLGSQEQRMCVGGAGSVRWIHGGWAVDLSRAGCCGKRSGLVRFWSRLPQGREGRARSQMALGLLFGGLDLERNPPYLFFFHGASFPNSSLDTANQLAWHIAKITGARRTMAVLCGRTGRTYLVPTSLPYF